MKPDFARHWFLIIMMSGATLPGVSCSVYDSPADGVAASSEGDYPAFPWPLELNPSSFGQYQCSTISLEGSGSATLVGDVADDLQQALLNAGYQHQRFYLAPDGFAIVTGLERTNEGGHPPEDAALRWRVSRRPPIRNVEAFFSRLFGAPAGQYRSFAFVFTTVRPVAPPSREASVETAEVLFEDGAFALPNLTDTVTNRHALYIAVFEYDVRHDYAASPPINNGRGIADNLVSAGIGLELC